MSRFQRGSASLEFVVVAVAVFIPILALSVTTSAVQTSQFAVASVARQGVRAFALSPSELTGYQRIAAIERLVRSDFGMKAKSTWSVTCSLNPCQRIGGIVRLTVSAAIPIAMVPALPGLTLPPSIRVTTTATHRVPVAPER